MALDSAVARQDGETAPLPGRETRKRSYELPSALHNIIADRIADQFRYGMKSEFLHDVGPVGFHGFDADLKNVGDLFVGLAFGHQFDDLPLPRTEPAGSPLRGRFSGGAAKISAQHHLRHPGSEEKLMLAKCFQGGDEVVARIPLENIAAGARAEHIVYHLFRFMHG